MNRIIRLNAPHISSQSDILKKYCDRSPIETDLVSEMALIRDRNIASVETGVTLKAPIKTPTTGVKSSETAMKNTENRSVHIEEILNKTPKAFSFLATIRSIAFFTTVVVWSWTGRLNKSVKSEVKLYHWESNLKFYRTRWVPSITLLQAQPGSGHQSKLLQN